MRLLILKANDKYLRFRDNGPELTSIEKASVYSLEKVSEVREKVTFLKNQGYTDVEIKQLTITEEHFEDGRETSIKRA